MKNNADFAISVCTYKDGTFEVMLVDPKTEREVMLSGVQALTPDEFDFIQEFAPACVWSKYNRYNKASV